MYREFSWAPLIEVAGSAEFNVITAQFGDGYRQSVGDGMNNKAQSWSLSFKGKHEKIEEIKFFLDEHKGFLPFYWAPKCDNGKMSLWDCLSYRMTNISHNGRNTGLWSLTCTFNQRFDE